MEGGVLKVYSKKFCRTCLSRTKPLILMGEKLKTVLQECTSVKLESANDNNMICGTCQRIIEKWSSFTARLNEIEIILSHQIEQGQPIQIVEDIKADIEPVKKEIETVDFESSVDDLRCYITTISTDTSQKYNREHLKCLLCEKVYFSGKLLKKHMKTKHGQKEASLDVQMLEEATPQDDINIRAKSSVCHLNTKKTSAKIIDRSRNFKKLTIDDTENASEITTPEKETDVSDERGYCCPECKLWFNADANITIHWSKSHSKIPLPYSCSQCDENFCVKSLLKRHEAKMHESAKPTAVFCEFCKKTFKSSLRLRRHVIFVHRTEPVSCPECNRVYKHTRQLREHMKTHRSEYRPERTLCVRCGISVRTISTHLRRCELRKDHKTYVCRFCKQTFNTMFSLRDHQKQLHAKDKDSEALKYECEVCGKRFNNSSNLYHHRKTHSDERPFVCSICLRPFKRQREVKMHMQVHTDVRPYECEYCGKNFRQRSKLAIHERIHTGEKPYSCSLCNAVFARNDTLKLHGNKQHNLR